MKYFQFRSKKIDRSKYLGVKKVLLGNEKFTGDKKKVYFGGCFYYWGGGGEYFSLGDSLF